MCCDLCALYFPRVNAIPSSEDTRATNKRILTPLRALSSTQAAPAPRLADESAETGRSGPDLSLKRQIRTRGCRGRHIWWVKQKDQPFEMPFRLLIDVVISNSIK